jgi:hypothetical protein
MSGSPEISLSESQPRYARTRERYLAWLASASEAM